MNQLVSYPRSGNTWYRYCLEYVLGRPTLGSRGSKIDKAIHKRVHIKLRKKDPIVRKMHYAHEINKNMKTIYLIRNPYEAVLSHSKRGLGRPLHVMIEDYMQIVNAYDTHDNALKQLVIYEEIITPCGLKSAITETAKFLGFTGQTAIQKIEKLTSETGFQNARVRSFKSYRFVKQKSLTLGKPGMNHYKSSSPKQLEIISEGIKRYPQLKDLYIDHIYGGGDYE